MMNLLDPPYVYIIVPDDLSAIGAMNAVKKSVRRFQTIFQLLVMTVFKMTQLMNPSLTTFCQNTYEIGRTAADLLIKIIKKIEIPFSQHNIIVGGHLIKGNTVKHI